MNMQSMHDRSETLFTMGTGWVGDVVKTNDAIIWMVENKNRQHGSFDFNEIIPSKEDSLEQ
ncbi:MAG: hypothetical protein KJ826_19995 [Proteobacteria bacterium]|nr:hypothetical protein [Pseudomonadota bacterium]